MSWGYAEDNGEDALLYRTDTRRDAMLRIQTCHKTSCVKAQPARGRMQRFDIEDSLYAHVLHWLRRHYHLNVFFLRMILKDQTSGCLTSPSPTDPASLPLTSCQVKHRSTGGCSRSASSTAPTTPWRFSTTDIPSKWPSQTRRTAQVSCFFSLSLFPLLTRTVARADLMYSAALLICICIAEILCPFAAAIEGKMQQRSGLIGAVHTMALAGLATEINVLQKCVTFAGLTLFISPLSQSQSCSSVAHADKNTRGFVCFLTNL